MQVRCNRRCGAVAELVMACCVRAACDSRAVGRMAHSESLSHTPVEPDSVAPKGESLPSFIIYMDKCSALLCGH